MVALGTDGLPVRVIKGEGGFELGGKKMFSTGGGRVGVLMVGGVERVRVMSQWALLAVKRA
jgi:hypothetical protein